MKTYNKIMSKFTETISELRELTQIKQKEQDKI